MFGMWTSSSRHPLHRARRVAIGLLLGSSLLASSACRSNTMLTHDGIRFEIEGDRRWRRVENERGEFHYDSPELSVSVSNGQLVINAVAAGPLQPGDHVQITGIGTVLVNGERRGDKETGRQLNEERVKIANAAMDSHKAAVERVQTADHERASSSRED